MPPTARPTTTPTAHPCTDGSHNCEITTTYCAVNGDTFFCDCLAGFYRPIGCIGCNATQCVATTTPTDTTPTALQGMSTDIVIVVPTTGVPLAADRGGADSKDGQFPWLYIVITVVVCTLAIVAAILYKKKSKHNENSPPPVTRGNQSFNNPVYDTADVSAAGATEALHNDPLYDETTPPAGVPRSAVVTNPTYADTDELEEGGGYVSIICAFRHELARLKMPAVVALAESVTCRLHWSSSCNRHANC